VNVLVERCQLQVRAVLFAQLNSSLQPMDKPTRDLAEPSDLSLLQAEKHPLGRTIEPLIASKFSVPMPDSSDTVTIFWHQQDYPQRPAGDRGISSPPALHRARRPSLRERVSTASVASARIRIGTREPSRRAVSPCVSNNTAERDPTQSQQTRPALDKQRAIKAIDRSLERGDRHNRKIRRFRRIKNK
jgi:hypothetical protein